MITGSVQEHILFLEFSDPVSRNSFSVRAAEEVDAIFSRELETEVAGAARDALKGVIFHAPGRVFCSGGNLSDYASMVNPEQGKIVNRRITKVLDRVSRLSIPTVCAVGGDCFGGGVELLSSFDRVITVSHAFFGLWQRRVALTFGWGGGARLEERLGRRVLRDLALRASNLTAVEALKVGLVDVVVPESQLLERAKAEVKTLSALPKAPFEPLKNFTSENEQEIFESLWWNEEHRNVLSRRRG